MTTTIYDPLLLHLRTTHDVDLLLSKIDEMLSSLYKTDEKAISLILTRELPNELSKELQKALTHENISLTHTQEIKKFFYELKTYVTSCTVMTLTLAFPPSEESIQLFSQKAKTLFGTTTVLEIVVHEVLIGGAVIVYKGKYLDYSLKSKLVKVFQTNSKELMTLMR